ncbi:dimethyl sulfoxide reductase anchor subunit family protein [Desulfonatronovibrio magnus]|uniref:dimethyl sulfoxide reductase anchor subunit family protein n=1 Tax=Desulfonatronovibrio magnus TaxID=698827 RepID=UPI0005EB3337|nr:DmsC/YnfH family molybdoenzyme membrane anchor subunit [Desulfonatronovibrio magnus]
MNSMELPLVAFTILSQAAIGMVIISSVRQYAVEGPTGNIRAEWIVAALILMCGIAASFLHLGHPLGAVNVIKHIGTAWLSREAVGVSLVLMLMIIGFATIDQKVKPALAAGTALMGVLAIFFTGMTYAPPGYPALNNILPFVFFLLTAATLGTAISSYFSPKEKMPLLTLILGAGLLVALTVYLIVPFIWFSAGTVMQQTAVEYLSSPLYWLRIVIGLAIPLGTLIMTRTIPVWVPVLILTGEIIGRIAFFSLTLHASTNIGGI